MISKRYALITALAAVSLVVLLGIIYFTVTDNSKNISRKPENSSPPKVEPKKPNPEQDYKWYIKFSVKGQKSTAYTEDPYAPVGASGNPYYFGGVAVHPRHPLQYGGKATVPILPFGTEIHLNQPINVQGEEIQSFVVMDTGDVHYGLWPDHPYWFDVYWGSTNYYNVKDARRYGAHLTDYYWYEPWK